MESRGFDALTHGRRGAQHVALHSRHIGAPSNMWHQLSGLQSLSCLRLMHTQLQRQSRSAYGYCIVDGKRDFTHRLQFAQRERELSRSESSNRGTWEGRKRTAKTVQTTA